MISVICTQCRAQLEMDDAFAGGVCRCQFCGTIQTVPPLSRLKKRQAAPEPAQTPQPAAVTAVPQGVQGGVAPRPQGLARQADNGLDALAEAVASSSGLGRGSLMAGPVDNGAAPAPPAPAAAAVAAVSTTPAAAVDYARPVAPDRRRTVVIAALAALAAVIIFFLGACYVWVGRATTTTVPLVTPPNPTRPPQGGGEGDGGEGGDVVVPRHPHFCGIDLTNESSIVYVLDRGQATAELFDTLKEATYRSLRSLKPRQKFAVIFWNNGSDETAYPSVGLAPATPAEVEAARQEFADVYAGGRADARPAIERAADLKSSVIVLVTGKAFDLEPELVDATTQAVGDAKTKVHTIALNSDDGNTVLGDISRATRGQTHVITRRQLRHFSD